MKNKIKKMYLRTLAILSLPMFHVICLYLYSTKEISVFLYPMIALDILMGVITFWLIHKLLYGKTL